MRINTHRFGPMEVPDTKLIRMERPILGFENLDKFCLIEIDDLAPFLWFQAVDDPHVAFMVVNPTVFFPRYSITINPNEIAELSVQDVTAVETYAIVSIDARSGQIFANLQGPILINSSNRKAKQLVLVNSDYRCDELISPDYVSVTEVEPVEEPELVL